MSKKIKSFDIDFDCPHGNYKLEDCKKLPTLEQIEETNESLVALGAGDIHTITIRLKR